MAHLICDVGDLKNDKELRRAILKQIETLADLITPYEITDTVRVKIGVSKYK